MAARETDPPPEVPVQSHQTDLLIVGSGAAGMTAALRARELGLDALIVEKGALYGGSTAMSGGVCWVGNNRHMAAAGIADSDEEVLTYLRAITGEEGSEPHLRAYRDHSKRMIDWLHDHTRVRFEAMAQYCDYYPEAPGGKGGGRSMEPAAFDGGLLGADFAKLRPPADSARVLGKLMIKAALAKRFIIMDLSAVLTMLWLMVKYALRWPRRRKLGRDPYLTNGNALAARLRMSCKDRDVPLWLNTPLRELVVRQGRVCGAIVVRDGEAVEISASRGVLLAAGGFSRNLAMRQAHGPAPASTEWTAGTMDNTGDGIAAGAAVGGALALMDEAWWTPTPQYPRTTTGWVLVVEKSLPGGIFVNGRGERFCNEAAPYVDVAKAMYADHQRTGCSVPAWMVFDGRYRRNYIAGPVGPGKFLPDKSLPRRLRKEFLKKAPTLSGLAEVLGVDAVNLEATVARYNHLAAKGRDEDFGRGDSASDRYYGDDRAGANPTMAALTQGPYYAIPVYPGDLGTKGGLVTDVQARVLDAEGQPIGGLYAAGNNTASIMARTYPGAGGTIGPAMCFGMLAAEHAAQAQDAGASSR